MLNSSFSQDDFYEFIIAPNDSIMDWGGGVGTHLNLNGNDLILTGSGLQGMDYYIIDNSEWNFIQKFEFSYGNPVGSNQYLESNYFYARNWGPNIPGEGASLGRVNEVKKAGGQWVAGSSINGPDNNLFNFGLALNVKNGLMSGMAIDFNVYYDTLVTTMGDSIFNWFKDSHLYIYKKDFETWNEPWILIQQEEFSAFEHSQITRTLIKPDELLISFQKYNFLGYDEETGEASEEGKVMHYIWNGENYEYYQTIYPPTQAYQGNFGNFMISNNEWLFISAFKENNYGVVHAYYKEGIDWVYTQAITPSLYDLGDKFGEKLDLEGEILVVSSAYRDDAGPSSGAVFVFELKETEGGPLCIEYKKLFSSDLEAVDAFGGNVQVSGDYIAVGAPLKNNLNGRV